MRKTKVIRRRGTRKAIPVERDASGRKVPSNAAFTVANVAAFTEVLSRGWSWQAACREIDVSRVTMYRHYRENEAFHALCDEAIEAGKDSMEDEAVRRGQYGVRRAIYHMGEVVGHQQEYSDRLLERALAARRPETWGRQSVDVNATVKSTSVVISMTFEQLKEEAAKRGLPVAIFQ